MNKVIVIVAGIGAYAVVKVGTKMLVTKVANPQSVGGRILSNVASSIAGIVTSAAVMQAVENALN